MQNPAGHRLQGMQKQNMMIGFRKHLNFYDGAPPRTVIARSEATQQSVSQTLQISERFRKSVRTKGKRIATSACGLLAMTRKEKHLQKFGSCLFMPIVIF